MSAPVLGHRFFTYLISYRFRWVYCQLEVLQHCFASSILQTLDQLPESLDDTYARVLSQIPQVNRANAHRMLQCLMVAVRPLRVEELAELLAFEFGKAQGAVPKYRADWRPNDQVEAVLSTCSSLIAIVDDQGSQVVQFSHFSVKEFLTSDRLTSSLGDFSQYHIIPGPAHTILAQACLGFLLHMDGHADEEMVKSFPLAGYAAKYWVTHAQFEDVASHVKDGMLILFDCDKPHFAAWVGIYDIDSTYQTYRERPFKRPTPLYYSSLCGFSDLVEHIAIKHPEQSKAAGGWHIFPLFAAVVRKHMKVAEILVEHGANVDIRGTRGRTPLHEAIRDFGMVQFLLKNGADVNCRQDDLRTPLHLAAYYGELKVAQILVEHKADVCPQDKEGMAPMHLLLENRLRDDDDIVDLARLLLEHGTDVNMRSTNKFKWTLLQEEAFMGRPKIARVLLDHGANPNAENGDGETALHLVSRRKNDSKEHGFSIARLLLEHGVNVHARHKYQGTALHSAAFCGNPNITQLLLDHGANPNAENGDGETALHVVSRRKDDSKEHGFSIARLLLEYGVNVHARHKYQGTALHSAAFYGSPSITQVLLDHGANPNAENKHGATPLHDVSQGEYGSQKLGAGIARLLLERGADPNARQKNNYMPLHWAAYKGMLEIVQLLLDHDVNPNAETAWGSTPLHQMAGGEYSSQRHGVGITRLLLERGADPNARQKNKDLPLHVAAYKGRLEIAQLLLDQGANTDAENKDGETPLHRVSYGEYSSQELGVGIARLLLERGADPNARQESKCIPLHWAAYKGRFEIAQVLLDHGANPNAENNNGATPLHLVSQGEYSSQARGVGISRLLLERGVDPNARQKNKWIPLHWAAYMGRLEIVQLLLDHSANPNAENEDGETPLHLVSQGEHSSEERGVGIARLLLEHGADPNARQKNKDMPLHWAAYKGRFEIVQLLLKHGANVNAETDEWCNTALHLVSRGEYDSQELEHGVGIARLLLEHGADIHARTKFYATALHHAAFSENFHIVRLLLEYGANPNAENEHGEIPLHLVSRDKYDSQEYGIGIVRQLLERDVDVNALDKDRNTPLHSASCLRRLEIVRVLLDNGAKVGSENDRALTPLHLVSKGGYWFQDDGPGVTKLLLERGADMHAQDKDYTTPSHLACYRGRLDIARVLLDHDAKAQAENDQDLVPSPSQ